MLWLLVVVLVFYLAYCCAFIFFQSRFIFRPVKLNKDHKFSPSQSYEELNITTNDGANLNALHLLPSAENGVILYFHGNWHNLASYLPYTKKFTDNGYSVLISDYRSYGKSSGHLNEELLFSDSEYWYDWALKKFPPEKITIYGRSLGTSVAAWLASRRPSGGLILETPFCHMYDIARRYGMLLPDGNYLKFGLRTDLLIQQVKVPVAILHGTRDETVSIHSARKLRKYLKPGDMFIEIEGGKHKTLENFARYHETIDELLQGKKSS